MRKIRPPPGLIKAVKKKRTPLLQRHHQTIVPTVNPCRSEASHDHSMIAAAHRGTQEVFRVDKQGNWKGDNALRVMEAFPSHWPLAKVTLPLKAFVHRLGRLIAGFFMELMATHIDPSLCQRGIDKSAKDITVQVATYLAAEIASLFRPWFYMMMRQAHC